MKLNFVWQVEKGLFQDNDVLLINGIQIATCSYNSTMSKNDTEEFRNAHQYTGKLLLPARLNKEYREQYAPTADELHAKLESIVTKWFETVLKETN
jgi:hypothetical protein